MRNKFFVFVCMNCKKTVHNRRVIKKADIWRLKNYGKETHNKRKV